MSSWNTFMSSAGIRSKTFDTYESALEHYDNVKPIRGRSPELRPLGSNRAYTQCQIVHNPLVDSVSAKLYDTECVTIFDNGLIKLNRGYWLSPSTANFIEAVLPTKFGRVNLSRRRMIYTNRTGQEYIIPDDGLLLQATEDWSSADVIQSKLPDTKLYEYKADRKVMNAIRKNIKPFLDTVAVMSSMSTTYDMQEITHFYPEVVTQYVDDYNEHNRKMKLKEEGNKEYENYYGYFYGSHILRHSIIKYASMPRLANLSGLAETIKARGGDTTGIEGGYRQHKDFGVSKFLSLVDNLFKDDAETVRKTMASVACNEASYGYESREEQTKVPTLFGDVELPRIVYEYNAVAMEGYIIDVIKYLYADLIFKRVEVEQGVLPSLTNEKYVLANQYLIKEQDIVTRRHSVL